MTIIASILPRTASEALSFLERAQACPGAGVVEIRMDFLLRVPLDSLLAAARKPLLVSCRLPAEGGANPALRDEERFPLFDRAREAGTDFIDVEFSSSYRPEGKGKTKIILSFHDVVGIPQDLLDRVVRMEASGRGDILKVACRVEKISEADLLWDAAKQVALPVIALGMGPEGVLTRLLYRQQGCWATYGSVPGLEPTAPGQIDVDILSDRYAVATIDPATAIFGILGHPLGHSLSPTLHRALQQETGKNVRYLPLETRDPEGVRQLADRIRLRGLSVTMPHKETVLSWGKARRPEAEEAGAANTLVRDGKNWTAHNTDGYGLAKTLEKEALTGQRVLLLGAGGAARAGLRYLLRQGAVVVLAGRDLDRAQKMAAEVAGTGKAIEVIPWKRLTSDPVSWQGVINATPVGMSPRTGDSPLPAAALPEQGWVMDMVYRPPLTRLLRDAREKGNRIYSGLEMFVRQAEEQHRVWWGEEPPAGRAQGAAHAALYRVITLVGFRGAGKTLVGEALTAALGWRFTDMDEELARRAGKPVARIFAEEGEEVFRSRETVLLHELLGQERLVVATGGGIVLREENRLALAEKGWTVWLDAGPEEILRRVPCPDPGRPPLTGLPWKEEVERLLADRRPWYRWTASGIVSPAGRPVADLVEEILRAGFRGTTIKE